jgi:hypothetical protein
MNRVAIGLIVGFIYLLFAPFIFTVWEIHALMNLSLSTIFAEIGTNPAQGFATWFSLGFQGDGSIFTIFGGIGWFFNDNTREIAWMTIMAWFSMGFIIGLIISGRKKSTQAVFGVYVTMFALWLIFAVLSQADLSSMFAGANLIDYLGVILTGILCSVLGGLIGASASGAGAD